MSAASSSKWRQLVSEKEQDERIGQLVRKKREAEIGYTNVDANIKEIGGRLEKLGSVLKNTVTGGEYHDLLNPLGQSGVDVSKIKELLEERNKLIRIIGECKEEIAKLGG
jgi:hypothetical protein